MAVNDNIFKELALYDGTTINDRVYAYLGALGYTGTMNDRLAQLEEGDKKGWQALLALSTYADGTASLVKQLFGNGEQGAFFIPKPQVLGQQVLFQDAAGTTPVTADGDPAGLMLDLRKGLVRGPEEVANGAFDTDLSGWSQSLAGYWQWVDGRAYHAFTSSYAALEQAGLGMAGSYSIIEFEIEVVSGSPNFIVDKTDTTVVTFVQPATPGVYQQRYLLRDVDRLRFARTGDGAEFYIDNISVRELPGNHATQATSGAKPIYRTDGVKHWLELDGFDDYVGFGKVQFAGGFFSAAALQSDTTSTSMWLGSAVLGGGEPKVGISSAAGFARHVTDAASLVGGVVNAGEDFIQLSKRDADDLNTLRMDAVTVASATYSGTAEFDQTAGSSTTASQSQVWDGRLYGIVLSSSHDESAAAESYLANLAGVTL